MNNRESFLNYLNTCVKSTRSTQNNPLYLAGNAPKDYARFLEPDRLFDYNPEKWNGLDMFSIDDPDEAERIFFELYNDQDFQKRNNKDNQGWRQGAISHYVCYLRAKMFFRKNKQECPSKKTRGDLPLQQISYGAPGTGKSHSIKRDTAGKSVIRTTFHPDSDYSTFVGAYKPVMDTAEVRVVPVVLNNGASFDQNKGTLQEKRISYKFVKQAFLKAYLGAWKKYAEAEESAEPQYLVIEEINRGNCAQIFGDLFQLLDRNDENGFSTYPVDADTDLQKEIKEAFKEEKDGEAENPYKLSKDIDVEGAVEDYTSNYNASLSKDIQEGRVLLLPPNLYIWATMNTSDQSLFPIDSAFKRRWDWKYIKITNAYKKDDNDKYELDADGKKIPLGWAIEFDYEEKDESGNVTKKPVKQDWWEFIQQINRIISSMTSSADKQLGYFFSKAKEGKIDAETFVGKVAFYLWNDVFKDYAMDEGGLFKYKKNANDNDSNDLTFPDFYDEDGDVNTFVVQQFIDNVMQWKDNENK